MLSYLLLFNYKTATAEYLLIALLSLIYIYMLRLISDVDNPFQYASKSKVKGGTTEVDPYPLQDYRRRFENKKIN